MSLEDLEYYQRFCEYCGCYMKPKEHDYNPSCMDDIDLHVCDGCREKVDHYGR
jgi:NADH pyrophosphatase NudC (nudix superfamily)